MSGAQAREALDFYHLPSSCWVAVKAALAATGTPQRVIALDPAKKSKDFLAVNPLGKVPALVADGQVLTEGGAINLWLAARHPEARLMPDLARAAWRGCRICRRIRLSGSRGPACLTVMGPGLAAKIFGPPAPLKPGTPPAPQRVQTISPGVLRPFFRTFFQHVGSPLSRLQNAR